MQTYQVRHRDRTTLFQGEYRSYQECVEDAVSRGISLDGADFSRADLSDLNLDGCTIRDANFSFANLSGANLSEAVLSNCRFENASLYNSCFCETQLVSCDFTDASFGSTDLAGARITSCIFSGQSALSLNWGSCTSIEASSYAFGGFPCALSRPPVIIQGLNEPVVAMLDHDVLIGQARFSVRNNIWQPYCAANIGDFVSPELLKAITLLRGLRPAISVSDPLDDIKSTKG